MKSAHNFALEEIQGQFFLATFRIIENFF